MATSDNVAARGSDDGTRNDNAQKDEEDSKHAADEPFVDGGSVASSRLEQMTWLNDPYVWWRHPVPRILITLVITALDMVLYVEDPVNDSHVPAWLPGLGHIYSLLFRWPTAAGLIVLRVILIPVALISGCAFGRQILHHRILRNCCKLEMFSGCNGTFMIMGVGCLCTALLAVGIDNMIADEDQAVSAYMGMEMREFSQLSQCCSITADIVAVLMIFDAVMQDRDVYPKWLPCAKTIWIEAWGGYFRVVAIWIIAVASFSVTFWSILDAGVGDTYNDTRIGGLTESGRATMMSVIIFCDLLTVAQDWDFPSFKKPLEVNHQVLIAGTTLPELHCDSFTRLIAMLPPCPACLKRCAKWLPKADFFTFTVTGSWLTYGPLLVIMCIDLFCTKTQIMYEPEDYGQYTKGGDGPGAYSIWTIRDEAYLSIAFEEGYLEYEAMVTWSARWNITTGEPLVQGSPVDFELNSQHTGTGLRYLCVIPGLVAMVAFPIMVYAGNKRKTMTQIFWHQIGGLRGSALKADAPGSKTDALAESKLEVKTSDDVVAAEGGVRGATSDDAVDAEGAVGSTAAAAAAVVVRAEEAAEIDGGKKAEEDEEEQEVVVAEKLAPEVIRQAQVLADGGTRLPGQPETPVEGISEADNADKIEPLEDPAAGVVLPPHNHNWETDGQSRALSSQEKVVDANVDDEGPPPQIEEGRTDRKDSNCRIDHRPTKETQVERKEGKTDRHQENKRREEGQQARRPFLLHRQV